MIADAYSWKFAIENITRKHITIINKMQLLYIDGWGYENYDGEDHYLLLGLWVSGIVFFVG